MLKLKTKPTWVVATEKFPRLSPGQTLFLKNMTKKEKEAARRNRYALLKTNFEEFTAVVCSKNSTQPAPFKVYWR